MKNRNYSSQPRAGRFEFTGNSLLWIFSCVFHSSVRNLAAGDGVKLDANGFAIESSSLRSSERRNK